MRVALMHNPTAGDENHSREGLTQALQSAGHDVIWQSTKEKGWERALGSSVDLVAVAGGDGTVRKVFKRLAGMDIPLTLLPVGSANNIATALGFEGDVTELVRGWERGHGRPYDLGLFTARGHEDMFVESVGGGIFAELLARDEERDDDAGGEEGVERGLELLRDTVASLPALPWDVEADGDDFSAELLAVETVNVSETGPNVPLAPEADPGDGLLDLVLVRPEERDALISYLDDRLAARAGVPPRFTVRRCQRIVLGAPTGSLLRLDDELLGHRDKERRIPSAALTLGPRLEVIVPGKP